MKLITKKSHPKLWEWDTKLGTVERLVGFHVSTSKYEQFRAEANSSCPHLSDEEKEAWAVHCARTHPGFHSDPTPRQHADRERGEKHYRLSYAAVVLLGVILLLLGIVLVRPAHGEPIPDRISSRYYTRSEIAETFEQGTPGISGPGAWQFDGSNNLKVNCITGCSATAGFSDNSLFTVGSTTLTPIGAYFTSGAAPAISSGNVGRVRMDASSFLMVSCQVGCSGSSFADNGAFTAGTTSIGVVGGWFTGSPTNCTSGSACAPQLTNDRKLFVQDFQGTSPWVVSLASTTITGSVAVTGTFFQATQPVSLATLPALTAGSAVIGHVIVDIAPTTEVTLPAGQAVELLDSGGTNKASISAAGAVKVDNSGVTQPVSGTVTTTPPANASTNVAQWASQTLGAMANYGTSPGAVLVPGVNAFITNTVPVTLASTTITGSVTVAQATAANLNATILGTLANNGAAAATNRVGTLDCIARTDYAGGTASTAGRDGAPDCGTDGLLHVAMLPAIRPASYHWSASFVGSSTTFAAHIAGNASDILLVTRITLSCTQTTAGVLTVTVNKTSAASTGGTAATITAVPDDSTYAAASSVAQSFTGTGPTIGTLVGQIDAAKVGCVATATASPNDIYVLNLRQKPIVLRGVAQTLEIGVGAATTGGNYTVTFEGIEITTITP